MSRNVLVTGRPGSGKTTLVLGVVERLAADGFKAGGFVTEEIREGASRAGFRVRDLAGDAAVLAHVGYRGVPRVGKYGVDTEAFERIALKALCFAGGERDFLVIDEIGKMELLSGSFRDLLPALLDSPTPLLATVHRSGDAFTRSLLDRGEVWVYELSVSGRDALREVVYGRMRGILSEVIETAKPEGGTEP